MKITRLLCGWMAAASLTTAPAVLASPQTTAAYNSDNEPLAAAVAAIEQKTGGRVAEIRYHDRNGRGVYDAEVIVGNALSQSRVDARTGKVIAFERHETPAWMLDWESRADIKSLAKATVPLPQAILTAEKASNGAVATDAGLAKPLTAGNSVLAYNVEVVRDGSPRRIAVDANTDEVIADPNMLETWSPEEANLAPRSHGSASGQ